MNMWKCAESCMGSGISCEIKLVHGNTPNKRAKLIHGDCLEEIPKISTKIDLIYCDLPFGTTQCKWDAVIPFKDMWDCISSIELSSNSPIVFHAQQPFTSRLISSNISNFKYTWVWEKSKATGFLNAKKRPLVSHEDIVVFCNESPRYYPQMTMATPYNKGVRKKQTKEDIYGKYNQAEIKSDGYRYPRSVQYFKTAETEGKTYHKTQKPLKLAEYIIKTYTKEGDMVLDFTMGSGTSGVACKRLNRSYIGIEKDKLCFNSAKERIENG